MMSVEAGGWESTTSHAPFDSMARRCKRIHLWSSIAKLVFFV
jgi:hypothetical protein